MARPVRIHEPHGTYLIQVRSRADEQLFTSEADRILFLRSLEDACLPHGVQVYAFALMDNSALIFLRAGDLPLSNFVHRTQAGYFNRLRVEADRSRPLIHDRHRAILVEDDPAWFLPVLRRVHLAPVIGGHWSNQSEARKWGAVSTNRWTSFPFYTGKMEAPAWLDRNATLDLFREQGAAKPSEEFYRYVIGGVKSLDGGPDVLDDVVAMSLLGSDSFVEQYYESAKGRRRSHTLRGVKTNGQHGERRFSAVAQAVADHFAASVEDLLRARTRHPGRKFLVELAMRHAMDGHGMKGLGKRMGVTGSALAHLRRTFAQQRVSDPELDQVLLSLEASVKERLAAL